MFSGSFLLSGVTVANTSAVNSWAVAEPARWLTVSHFCWPGPREPSVFPEADLAAGGDFVVVVLCAAWVSRAPALPGIPPRAGPLVAWQALLNSYPVNIYE